MDVIDYNGTDKWSRGAILERYQDYAQTFGVTELSDLTPREHVAGTTRWIFPVMEMVIPRIDHGGDKACIEIGLEFIEEDKRFPFGKILKANTARALRRATLSDAQGRRIQNRVLGMLVAGHVPREYREYAKLLRKVGLPGWWRDIESQVDRSNRYVMRWFEFFKKSAETDKHA